MSATTSPIKSLLSKVYPRIASTKVARIVPASKMTPISAPIRFSLSFISEFPRFLILYFASGKSIAHLFIKVKIKVWLVRKRLLVYTYLEKRQTNEVKNMALLKKWRDMAYSETANKGDLQRLWVKYFEDEKEIYATILKTPDTEVKGTVKELAEKFGVDIMTMTGFLDGINDSLVKANPIDEMEEDTEVSLKFDKALLYKNMVAAGADWLYELEEWNDIFDEETRKALYKEQKSSTTIVKEERVYPNDPCPCGSGKKYKKCCGKNK